MSHIGFVCESVDNSAIGENRACCISDISDMERIVSVTEDMKHDVSVGDMACDVDVACGDGNAKKTYIL